MNGVKGEVPFWLTFTPFLIWHDPVIFNEKLRKSYSNRLCKISARSTDIPQSLRKSAKPMPKMNSGSSKTPIYQKIKIVAKCCRMLQDVASHYISELGCLTTLRTTALKSPSRNYPTKSKYKFETKIHSCNVASPSISCKTRNTLLQVHQPPCRWEGWNGTC